jgi:hypothetical protein
MKEGVTMRNHPIRSFHALLLVLLAPAAFALNNRSAVSVNGLDTNPCTTTSPCRSFGYAMSQTSPGGEIIALDSAGYGPFIINQAITVSGAPGIHAAITTTSGDGIAVGVSLGSDRVIIRNLVLIGAGGAIGIHQTYCPELRVIACLIRGFGNAGIQSESSSGDLTVSRTSVLDNPGFGVKLSGGLGLNLGTITDSAIEGNTIGLHADYNTRLVVANSTITGSFTGAEALSSFSTGLLAALLLESCTIAHNTTGVRSTASGSNNAALVYISQDVLAFNGTGVVLSGAGASVDTFLNNRFTGNTLDGGPLTTIAFK